VQQHDDQGAGEAVGQDWVKKNFRLRQGQHGPNWWPLWRSPWVTEHQGSLPWMTDATKKGG